MRHIVAIAQSLEMSPADLKPILQTLGIVLTKDGIEDEMADKLQELNQAAQKQGITLLEAAQHLVAARNAQATTSNSSQRFDLDLYILQQFKQDPRTAAPGSSVDVIHRQAQIGENMGVVGYVHAVRVAALKFNDCFKHGLQPEDLENNPAIAGADNAVASIYEAAGTDFFGHMSWEETTPALNGPQQRALADK